jgi:hypothetical protein
MRRLIGSRAHGMIDYPTSALMMATPWVFRLDRKSIASWLPLALGASATVYSLLTDYELSAQRRLSLKTHLVLDAISGAMLAASPLLFRTRRTQWIPNVAIGLFEVATALLTKQTPDDRAKRSSRRRSARSSSGSSSRGILTAITSLIGIGTSSSTSRRSSSRGTSSRSSSSRGSSSEGRRSGSRSRSSTGNGTTSTRSKRTNRSAEGRSTSRSTSRRQPVEA